MTISLMIFHNNKLYALLPANEDGDVFYSHQGLTYAGLLTTGHASAENICQVFVAINTYLKQRFPEVHLQTDTLDLPATCQPKRPYALFKECRRKSAPEALRASFDLKHPLKMV